MTIAPGGCGQRGKKADWGEKKFRVQLRQIPSRALQPPKKGLGVSRVQAQSCCSFPHSRVSANVIPYQGCTREEGKARSGRTLAAPRPGEPRELRAWPAGRAPMLPWRCGRGGPASSAARRCEGSLWWLSQAGAYSFPRRVYVT